VSLPVGAREPGAPTVVYSLGGRADPWRFVLQEERIGAQAVR